MCLLAVPAHGLQMSQLRLFRNVYRQKCLSVKKKKKKLKPKYQKKKKTVHVPCWKMSNMETAILQSLSYTDQFKRGSVIHI